MLGVFMTGLPMALQSHPPWSSVKIRITFGRSVAGVAAAGRMLATTNNGTSMDVLP